MIYLKNNTRVVCVHLCTGQFFYEQYRNSGRDAEYLRLDLNHFVTSVLPKSSFLTPTTRRAPEINVLAADSVNLNVHGPLETPLLLHDDFLFCNPTVTK